MPDNGLIGWLSESWVRVMIACAIWEGVALLATGAVLVIVWLRLTPEWSTQINRLTGQKKAGMRNYLIGWGAFFSLAPTLTAAIYTGHVIMGWIGLHSWVVPVAAVTAVLAVVAVIAWKTRDHLPKRQQAMPELAAAPPQQIYSTVYDMPYGQWSSEDQVIR